MGLNDLQSHFTQNIGNTVESVDLLKIAHASRVKKPERGEKFKLLVDAECCLDRLYGGYFPDWVCGGQWNKMDQFLRNFGSVVQNSNLELVICFNGALEPDRLETEWKLKQEETYKFIEEIHRHVTHKKKPPPKIWWVPPAYLRSAIRSTFRCLQIRTMSTLEDHHKEIVTFCQKHSFNGIVADDPEYLVFDIPRYFSAQKLKLTFKGSLETVELKLKTLYESLNLPKDKFHIFAALLGNHLLPETDLKCFYNALNVDPASKTSVIEKLGDFIRELESNDIDKVVELITKLTSDTEMEQSKEFPGKVAHCLRYYSDLSISKAKEKKAKSNKGSRKEKGESKGQQKPQVLTPVDADTAEPEPDICDEMSVVLPSDTDQKLELEEGDSSKVFVDAEPESEPSNVINGNGPSSSNDTTTRTSLDKLLYRVNPEIENVCTTRHKTGLMSPYIYHILKHKEVKLPVIIQESKDSDQLPRAHELFRPLRQRVYAVLFNLHHLHFLAKQRNEKVPTVLVKETMYCPHTKAIKSELIQAVEVGWGVPTVERLWLGDKEDCKKKRTKTFLAILKSDKTIIVDSTFVPQQMLVLTCVLRYILSTEKKVMRKSEVEALIAQAFIQELTDPGIAQDIEVANLTMRGVHLAHLFMEGVEMAVLANDACGAPIPFHLFSPCMFFNGKVFNYVMEQQNLGKSLAEICGYKMDLLFGIDQLRLACTEGIRVQYAAAPNPAPLLFGGGGSLMSQMGMPGPRASYLSNQLHTQGPGSLSQLAAAAAVTSSRRLVGPSLQSHNQNPFVLAGSSGSSVIGGLYGSYPGSTSQMLQSRGVGVPIYDIPGRQRRIPTGNGAGGQLEVAGMVVGSWNGNYNNTGGSLMPGVRNPRIPMGPGMGMGTAYANPNVLQMNSLLDQMRITGGRQPAFRQVAPGSGWINKKNYNSKPQRKPVGKKGDGNYSKPNGQAAAPPSSNINKAKGVSFMDEPRLDTGAGDATMTLENKDSQFVRGVRGEEKEGITESSRSNLEIGVDSSV